MPSGRNPNDLPTELQSDTDLLESVKLSLANANAHPEAPQLPGYVLTALLGEGAFGQVWSGVQRHTAKKVAVKVFKRQHGLDWIFLQREIERLVKLDAHPHVVTLLDAGLDHDPPYYVMELMGGGDLTAHVRAEPRAPLDQVLRWMKELAEALSYIHGRGLIHCDLKPANVLVDDQGHIRLSDFGQSRIFTEASTTLGTLFYMPPEQAKLPKAGDPAQADVRWDIYAFGATIHALVVGHAPHESSHAAGELANADTRTRLQRYRQLVHDAPALDAGVCAESEAGRELRAILAKCLAFDVSERYGSAAEILADLSAIQQKRPISPFFQRRAYRAKKFVQRNPFRITLVAVIALAIIGFGVTSQIQASKLAKERDRVAVERDRANKNEKRTTQAIQFLQGMFAYIAKSRVQTTERESTVKRAISLLSAYSPNERGSLLVTVADSLALVGQYADAATLIELCLGIQQKEFGANHAETLGTRIYLGDLRFKEGQIDKAIEAYEGFLALEDDPHLNDSDRFNARRNLAVIFNEAGRYDEAYETLAEAAKIRLRQYGKRDQVYGASLHDMALAQLALGDLDLAETHARQAVEVYRSGPSYAPGLATTLSTLAAVLTAKNNLPEALASSSEALKVGNASYDKRHPRLGHWQCQNAAILRKLGREEEARSAFVKGLSILDGKVELSARRFRLGCGVGYAKLLDQRDDTDSALAQLQLGMEVCDEDSQSARLDLVCIDALSMLGEVQTKRGEWERAERALQRAMDRIVESPNRQLRTRREAQLRSAFVDLYEAWGLPEKASEWRSEEKQKLEENTDE